MLGYAKLLIGIIKNENFDIFLPALFLVNQVFADCDVKDLSSPAYLRSVGKENLIELFKIQDIRILSVGVELMLLQTHFHLP